MYKCEACGAVFTTPGSYKEDTGGYETGVGYYPYYEEFSCCPECESQDFDEASRCHDCEGVFFEAELVYCNDGEVRCRSCAGEFKKED